MKIFVLLIICFCLVGCKFEKSISINNTTEPKNKYSVAVTEKFKDQFGGTYEVIRLGDIICVTEWSDSISCFPVR